MADIDIIALIAVGIGMVVALWTAYRLLGGQ